MSKTRKNIPWKGWKQLNPNTSQRNKMSKRCGKKCFLGTKQSFPICIKNTCKISKKGIYAAYIRAREYRNKGSKYRKIASKAKKLLYK
jgi:hypothetical protein